MALPTVEGERLRDPTGAHRFIRRFVGVLRPNLLFLSFLSLGTVVRWLVVVTYRHPFVQPDSMRYLYSAVRMQADRDRPSGYSVFVHLFPGWSHLWPITAVQHLLGLAMAVGIYWMLVSRCVPRWGAALATVPVLLDPFQLSIEHYILSDVLFELFVLSAFIALSVRRRVSWQLAALAGLLIGCATVTRATGDLLVTVAVAVLLLGQARWRPAVALLIATAIPVIGYMAWYKGDYGTYSTGRFPENLLYGRTAEFVNCGDVTLPAYEKPLCPREPRSKRGSWYFYTWSPQGPIANYTPPKGKTTWEVLHDYNRRVIKQEPLAYARLVLGDAMRGFEPWRQEGAYSTGQIRSWRFTAAGHPEFRSHRHLPLMGVTHPSKLVTHVALAGALEDYSHVYLPGPVFAACLAIGLLATAGVGRARHSGLRSTVALFVISTVILLLISTAVSIFSWRYQLPQFILLPPAAALGLVALLRRDQDPEAMTGWESLRSLIGLRGRRGACGSLTTPPGEGDHSFPT